MQLLPCTCHHRTQACPPGRSSCLCNSSHTAAAGGARRRCGLGPLREKLGNSVHIVRAGRQPCCASRSMLHFGSLRQPPALLCLSFNAACWQFTLHSPWLHLWVAAGHMQLLKQAAPGVQLGCREEVVVQSALCLAVMCMLRSAHPLHNQATFYRQAVLLSRAAPHFHAASVRYLACAAVTGGRAVRANAARVAGSALWAQFLQGQRNNIMLCRLQLCTQSSWRARLISSLRSHLADPRGASCTLVSCGWTRATQTLGVCATDQLQGSSLKALASVERRVQHNRPCHACIPEKQKSASCTENPIST